MEASGKCHFPQLITPSETNSEASFVHLQSRRRLFSQPLHQGAARSRWVSSIPVSICLCFKLGLALGVELAAGYFMQTRRPQGFLRDKQAGKGYPSLQCYREPSIDSLGDLIARQFSIGSFSLSLGVIQKFRIFRSLSWFAERGPIRFAPAIIQAMNFWSKF